jgi:DNA-binding GntR family transcriptional regulator
MPIDSLSNNLAPLPKRSLAEDIVDRLREAIYSGELAPNERLREEVLASVLGLSRGPVREALAQLEREGLVIRQPNRGATVARLSLEDLEEVYSLRLALEQLAIRQAIKNAEPMYFDKMQAVVDEMQTCLDRGITTQEAARLDIHFHELIYEASHHKRLLNVWSTLRPQIHIFLLSRNVVNKDFREVLVTDHQKLLDLMRAGDEDTALTMLQAHLKGAYERVFKSHSDWLQGSEKPKAGLRKVPN